MKKTLTTWALLIMAVVCMAVPAKKGVWKVLQLADGTEVRAQLMGDERLHFWQSADGLRYVQDGDVYTLIEPEQLKARAMSRRANHASAHKIKKASIGERTAFTGQKKGLVILVEYTDVKFKSGHDLEKYENILNTEGYTTSEGFKGSVADYFKAQSGGIFELTFDVVGPVTMKNNRKYYGANDSRGDDKHPDDMVVEACMGVDEEVNFADYDWDGDGVVDQVFVLYAGKGEADSGTTEAIWPHEYELSYTDSQMTLDGVLIDTYACSNEIDASGKISGIGTFCHEFSHCMGYPDFYDILYDGHFGMSQFDLMDQGSYNGNAFVPAGYSAYEKMMASWLEPVELDAEDMTITGLQPISEQGGAYIIYNKGHKDEFYMVENRQKTGWDAELPSRGLMITHVDFDKEVWQNNIPNSILSDSKAAEYGLTKGNDHQRMTIFHADNDDDSKYWSNYSEAYTKTTLTNDLYPYKLNDSLTNTSKPAATLYHANTDGKMFMNKGILGIKQNTDGTMDFTFRATASSEGGEGNNDKPNEEGVLFYESFNECDGKGANDDLWGGNIASAAFNPDNEGWETVQAYGANRCARFNTSSKVGDVITPSFNVSGDATMTFMAAAWNNDGTDLQLSIEGDATITPTSLQMNMGGWSECTASIKGNGTVRVVFTPAKRMFLDEVMVKSDSTLGVVSRSLELQQHSKAIYTIDGRYVGTDASVLKPGLYVIGGRKVVR